MKQAVKKVPAGKTTVTMAQEGLQQVLFGELRMMVRVRAAVLLSAQTMGKTSVWLEGGMHFAAE